MTATGRGSAAARWRALATAMGVTTSLAGAYASYFFDGSTGGCIVTLQSALFVAGWIFGPKHGMIAAKARRRAASFGAISEPTGETPVLR